MNAETSFPALFAAALLAAACTGSAFAETRSYSESGFTGVSVSAGINLELKQGAFAVTADGDKKSLDRLVIERKGDTLHIGRKSGSSFSFSTTRLLVTVSAPDISSISASSGADVDGSGLRVGALSVSVSSGADVELAGTCSSLSVSVSSGSDFEGSDLKCEAATVSASSGADADIFASKSVTASASSGGDVTIHGNPGSVTKDESSGGDVSNG